MENTKEYRLEKARRKIKEVFDYEKLKALPQYKHLTESEFGTLVDQIELFVFLVIKTSLHVNKELL